MSSLLEDSGSHTVCVEAHCPNLTDCFSRRQATFLILGAHCTRSCRFCSVGKISPEECGVVDTDEPGRVAYAVRRLGLDYVVVTSVTRDDLADGGASQFVRTIEALRAMNPAVHVEVLTPDFKGEVSSIRAVRAAGPVVYAHNLETVPRLTAALRPQADYQQSLDVLACAASIAPSVITKSSLMLGLGERPLEVIAACEDLYRAGCQVVTLGQYLSPSSAHYPVQEFISPETFARYAAVGREMGFKKVFAGPLVRSSYRAGAVYREVAYV